MSNTPASGLLSTIRSLTTDDLRSQQMNRGRQSWTKQPGSRKNDDGALRAAVCRSLQGVSTRKIEKVLEQLGIAGVSAGQVSQLCADLDEKVRQFRERKLGTHRYVWVEALYEKVREDSRVESMAVVIATGVNEQGRREVLGFDVIPTESEEGWGLFFKDLKERGLNGVQLVISDAHSD